MELIMAGPSLSDNSLIRPLFSFLTTSTCCCTPVVMVGVNSIMILRNERIVRMVYLLEKIVIGSFDVKTFIKRLGKKPKIKNKLLYWD